MSRTRRRLLGLVGILALAMVAIAIWGLTHRDSPNLRAVSGIEVALAAALVLPWVGVYAFRAATRFGEGDQASSAWKLIAYSSILLTVGNLCAYLPNFVRFGDVEGYVLLAGHYLPAVFRIALCVALLWMRKAYLDTGLPFRLTKLDFALAAGLASVSVFLLTRQDVLFQYWAGDTLLSEGVQLALTVALVFNFLIYAVVFFLSLTMYRYATQMGGGLVARAWGGVALYGMLQPLHAFAVAAFLPIFGPLFLLVCDNFIVLAAFAALAIGPVYQIEAARARGTHDLSMSGHDFSLRG